MKKAMMFLYVASATALFSPPSEAEGVQTHYGNPFEGCMNDEVAIRIQGLKGEVCAPECTNYVCPTDEPLGASAKPACALQDARSNKKFCTLLCTGKVEGECGEGAACQSLGMLGVCTYTEETESQSHGLRLSPESRSILTKHVFSS